MTFNNVAASFTLNSATRITATVPTGATTGRIRVTTPSGTATSGADFIVTHLSHARTVSLRLREHLVAKGEVTVADGFAVCLQNVPVKIQRNASGDWRIVASTVTGTDGTYRLRIPDRPGDYRAKVKKLALAGGGFCGQDHSPSKHHRHR